MDTQPVTPTPAPTVPLERIDAGASVSDVLKMRYEVLANRIIHWMMTHPGRPLTQCARELGLNVTYLYTFTSSDTFKARYAELSKGDDGFEGALLGDFKERLRAGAAIAIDALTEKLTINPHAEDAVDAAEILIYGAAKLEAPRPIAGQVNFNMPSIPPEVLATTQQAMFKRNTPATVDATLVPEGSVQDTVNAAGLQATG